MNEDLVVAATFEFPAEAEVAASMLGAEGIDSVIDKPFVGGLRFDWLFGNDRRDGVRLLVRSDDLELARALLEPANDEE